MRTESRAQLPRSMWVVAGTGGSALVFALVMPFAAGVPSGAGVANVLLLPLPILATGLFATSKRADHPTARRLLLVGAAFAVATAAESAIGLAHETGGGRSWLWVAVTVDQVATVASSVWLAWLIALFPDGRREGRYAGYVLGALWTLLAAPVLLLFARPTVLVPDYLFDHAPPRLESPLALSALEPLAGPAEALYGAVGLTILVGAVLVVLRYRRSQSARRSQIRWLLLAALLSAMLEVAQALLRASGLVPGSTLDSLYVITTAPAVLFFLAAILIALFRHNALDVDLAIRRSLVYGALSLAIGALYLAAATALGIAAGERFPVGIAVLVTVAATLGFQPLRRRVDRIASRLILGERLSGYELLAHFGETLEHAFDVGELCQRIAVTVRDGLGLRWARVELSFAPDGHGPGERVAAAGIALDEPVEPELAVALTYGNERVGTLECGPKHDGALNAPDRALLSTLGRQAALGLHNARLASELAARLDEIRRQADDLAASRARIVHAEDAGRRRIERNIHDGVQQQVVALAAKLRLARSQLRRSPELADATLAELQEEARHTLEDIRELARGIHPAVLTDRGLVEAIEARAGRLPLYVTVHSDPRLRGRRFSAEVEAALYFVVSEALANAMKHARAEHVRVSIAASESQLEVEVSDDGTGFDPAHVERAGLTSLADRVAALGGRLVVTSRPGAGTAVRAALPARTLEEIYA